MQQKNSQYSTCTKCNVSKPLSNEFFQRDSSKRTGFRPECKECVSLRYKSAKEKTPRIENITLSKSGLKRCSACKNIMKTEFFCKSSRNFDGLHGKCKFCLSDERREKRNADKEKFDAPMKAYKARNKEKVRARATKYTAERRKKDGVFRFRGAVSRLVGSLLKKKESSKSGKSFFDAIGYTADDLYAHIEKQFLAGMSWENYGSWHLDHIIPNSDFKYSSMSDSEFKSCWSLANLRPLWAEDNLKKSNKITSLL